MTQKQVHETIELELAIFIIMVQLVSKRWQKNFIWTTLREAGRRPLWNRRSIYRISDSQDVRAYHYDLSELGRKELISYKEARAARIEKLLQGWPEEEQEQFGKLLRKFNQVLLALS